MQRDEVSDATASDILAAWQQRTAVAWLELNRAVEALGAPEVQAKVVSQLSAGLAAVQDALPGYLEAKRRDAVRRHRRRYTLGLTGRVPVDSRVLAPLPPDPQWILIDTPAGRAVVVVFWLLRFGSSEIVARLAELLPRPLGDHDVTEIASADAGFDEQVVFAEWLSAVAGTAHDTSQWVVNWLWLSLLPDPAGESRDVPSNCRPDQRLLRRLSERTPRSWAEDLLGERISDVLAGAETTASLNNSSSDDKAVPPVAKGVSWGSAMKRAEDRVRSHGGVFPGRNALADIVGCSRATMSKVIKRSRYLTARQAEAKDRRNIKPRESAIEDLDGLPGQGCAEAAGNCEAEAELDRLTREQAQDEARDKRRARPETS